MNYKNENQDMQVEGIISNPLVAQDILKQLKGLIEKHWGKDPVYYTGSRNKEEASAANVCCEILGGMWKINLRQIRKHF